ncbi:hypothetical protein [Streptomyces toxytricini]|uniref:hypothetical protein n=1 Tax=Streptomyces toxytricini TaxID=67369 RepID=UPI00342EDC20
MLMLQRFAGVTGFGILCPFGLRPRGLGLVLLDVDLLGFWNSGTALTALLDLDINRSGTNRKLSPDS